MRIRSMGQSGVTLTELMVVLAIIVIMAAIGTPYVISNLSKQRAKSAVRDVMTDMRLARSLAVSNNTPYFVCFTGSGSNQRYQIDQVQDPGTATDCSSGNTPTDKSVDLAAQYTGIVFGYKSGLSSCPNNAVGIQKAINFTNDRATFSSRGASMNGPGGGAGVETGRVYLMNTLDSDERTYCIHVEGTTGRARLYEWKSGSWQ